MPLSLPDRASLEFLKKLSKERLALLRLRNPESRLADAQLAIARDYGFRSWRALKAEVEGRRAPNVALMMKTTSMERTRVRLRAVSNARSVETSKRAASRPSCT